MSSGRTWHQASYHIECSHELCTMALIRSLEELTLKQKGGRKDTQKLGPRVLPDSLRTRSQPEQITQSCSHLPRWYDQQYQCLWVSQKKKEEEKKVAQYFPAITTSFTTLGAVRVNLETFSAVPSSILPQLWESIYRDWHTDRLPPFLQGKNRLPYICTGTLMFRNC